MAAKKIFKPGQTASGILDSKGGDKLKQMQANSNYNFKFIPKDKIIPNEKNKNYSQDNIEALSESIIINGLRHNLSVIHESTTDQYRIVSGERRYHAINLMNEKTYKELFPTGIPCKVEKSSISEIDEEIMLISANHDIRETSIEEKRWEIRRLKELYEAKKLNGEITNISKEIAKQLNISQRQAIKYVNAEKLIPELSDLLNQSGISLEDASKFSRLDEWAQLKIVELLNAKGSVDPEELESIKKISQEKEEESKKNHQELERTLQLLAERDKSIEALERRIQSLQTMPEEKPTNDLKEELKYISDAKEKAEREKQRLETQLEKMKLQQKERESRNTSISDTELKRISQIAKTEQALQLFETNFSTIKNNKSIIKSDPDLKTRLEILNNRINDLLSEINL
jgi:ParB-like nuclease domain.